MKKFRPLSACGTSGKKRKGNDEDHETNPSLVLYWSEEKGEEKKREDVKDDARTTPKIEKWEHSIFSESSDDERTYSHHEVTYPLTDDDILPQAVDLEFSRDLYRRLFVVTDEKYDKLTKQDEIATEFRMSLNEKKYITHESNPDDIYNKLESKGLTKMPKKVAMRYIRGAIYTKSYFHQHEHKFKLVKKLVTLVPCIMAQADYKLVTKYLRKADIACDFNDDVIFSAIIEFREVVDDFEDRFHPIIRKDRIEELITFVDRYYKKERRRLIQDKKSDRTPPRYAQYVKRKEETYQSSKDYQDALKVVQLHQDFHTHVASCNFIKHTMKIKDLLKDKRVVEARFEALDMSLMIDSLKMRLDLLKEMHAFTQYEAWLHCLFDEKLKLGRSRMDEVLDKIRVKHPSFPQLSYKWSLVDLKHLPLQWTSDQQQEELSSFYDSLDIIKDYTSCPVSYSYLVEGILFYLDFVAWLESEPNEPKVPQIFGSVLCFKEKVWDEAFYDHSAYTDVYEYMSTVFC